MEIGGLNRSNDGPVRASSGQQGGYDGLTYRYAIPHVAPKTQPKPGERTAVIVGAGVAGLMAALTMQREGYDQVLVLEKRESFSRMNVINLHPESLHALKRLGILKRFLRVASRILDHQNYVFLNGERVLRFRDTAHDVEIDPERTFEPEEVLDGFSNETMYSVSLADLQHFLAAIAVERGVLLLPGSRCTLHSDSNGCYSAVVERPCHQPLVIERPTLIVIADGAKSVVFRELGGRYRSNTKLPHDEYWVFGHYGCDPEYGLCHLMLEFDGRVRIDDLAITNSIFLPERSEVNIAVTVQNPEIDPQQIRELVGGQARKVLRDACVEDDGQGLVWNTRRATAVVPIAADRLVLGKNVVLAGDSVGSGSPIAALGGTLATSVYPYALRRLAIDLEAEGSGVALQRYSARARASVEKWHAKALQVRSRIREDIHPRSQQIHYATR